MRMRSIRPQPDESSDLGDEPLRYQKQGAFDLEACEGEPIQFIGAVQAPYAMVIWRPQDGAIVAMTTNLPEVLGLAAQTIRALRVHDLFLGDREEIDKALSDRADARHIVLVSGKSSLARGCRLGPWHAAIIDPVPAQSWRGTGFDAVVSFNALIEAQLAKESFVLAGLAAGLAAAFRGISGYDRVMVYQFDADCNGQIIAEDADPSLDSRFLGLTFPSSDIPRPARELFLKNRVRPLIDVQAEVVPIVAFDGQTAQDFDLGALPERAVSPIHLTYLTNMGVRSTLTIAVMVQDRLWGLLTCHHYSGPRRLSGPDLALCRVLCDLLSHGLSRARDAARLAQQALVDALGRTLRTAAQAEAAPEDFGTFLRDFEPQILTLLDVSGAVITLGSSDFWLGAAPPAGFAALRTRLDTASGQTVFSTTSLARHFPDLAASLLPECAGLIRIGNAARTSAMMAWRPAVPTAITWAGDPEKRVQNTGALTPRTSFEKWRVLSADTCASWTTDHDHLLTGLFCVLSEVGWTLERRRAERKVETAREQVERARTELEHAALHDVLTGLPNRRYLDMVLADLAGQQGGSGKVAALQIDLDRFKVINDTLGHAVGDEVLLHVAEVLRKHRRETDIVARVGGDEFVLIARDNLAEELLEELAQGIIDEVSRPIVIRGEQVSFSASIGVALALQSGLMPETLLSRADIALYESKHNGRGQTCFVSDAMEQTRIERRKLGEDVLRGFAAGEFALFYQLQFSASTRQVSGAEALLRWNHRVRGLLSPQHFLEAAEDIGVIEKLDSFSVETALEVQRRWSERGLVVPKISVNVSARRLKDMNVARMVKEHPDMAGRIAFELLETMDINTIDTLSKWNIQSLQDAGIALEIDDFGAGHTSILSLVHMKPDRIKIDKDLVLPAPDSQTARDVIRSIISIAKTLNIGVTAEGVETEAHVALMRSLGCDTLQGYALARPMSFDEIAERFIGRKTA